MTKCKYHPYIDAYMDTMRSGKVPASKDLLPAMDYVEFKLSNPDV